MLVRKLLTAQVGIEWVIKTCVKCSVCVVLVTKLLAVQDGNEWVIKTP